MADGQNVAPLVVKDFREDEGAYGKEQKMAGHLVEEVRLNPERAIMGLALVSN